MSQKKYVSLSKLSTFLDNLSNKFAALSHKHTMSDITDLSNINIEVDTELSSASTNPVANSTLNAEFDAIGQAFVVLEDAVDNHSHSEYITEDELNAKGYLTSYTETDPTVPAWAKAANKPTYTASEVGADASGSASAVQGNLNTHLDNKNNPHEVNLTQLGVTATAAELNTLDGITATTTELNYVSGVTSNIQEQLDSKQATITGGATTITSSNLTASRALISDANGKVAVSDITSMELSYLDGVTSAIQSQLDSKVNKADIATTAMQGTAAQNTTYWKISNFGNWGTGNWTQKGFSMIITSRAGEMIWVSLAANDSNTSAGAIRLINRYSKIAALHYSVSESAIYVTAAAWANNICAHVISNVNGDYVPTVNSASALPSDAVSINIIEFGINSTSTVVGDNSVLLEMGGSADRPTYNSNNMALYSDVTTVDTKVTGIDTRLTALENSVVSVHSGSGTPIAELGEDGDIYLVTE